MSDCAPSSFPQDLLTDILVQLPVKSIGRFRGVSKSWRTLLSSPKFIKDHLAFHNLFDPEKLIFKEAFYCPLVLTFTTDGSSNDGISRKVVCPILDQTMWAKIEGSCHGLVLLINSGWSMILMNPITLQCAKIPNFGLSFDPIVVAMYGLGYDESTDDYKIVSLSYYDNGDEHKTVSHSYYDFDYEHDDEDSDETFVDIYSVKMQTWKRLANSPYNHTIPHVAHGIFVNGCLHWLACDTKTQGCPSVIAAFNLALEKFEKVPPPRDVEESKFLFNQLTVLGGCLALIVVNTHESVFDVWVMKEYGMQESWSKFTINYPEDRNPYWFKVACLLRDDEIVWVRDYEKLVVYSLSTGGWRDMEVVDVTGVFGDGIMTFKESLLSPNQIGELMQNPH
ncbi:OLC1v1020417C1 [Oldenlandia corymbosa var. corymbosa]|uniref:OLC1v1020417C1 n=1 Tax=Oldenlandia corymbosa var. corymbosa TaxID=529605 RepID=A0AAV1EGJ8_OLDCO|nr:OLC1v1020417C1 [Oldenlandia corymbosa var. corymbosa]